MQYVAPALGGLLSRTADASFAVDAESHILFANDAFSSLCQQPRSNILGRSCCQVVRGHTLTGEPFCGPRCPVKDRLRQGEHVENFDLAVPQPRDNTRWVNAGTICTPAAWRPVIAIIILRPISLYHSIDRFVNHRQQRNTAAVPESLPLTRRELQVLRCIAEGKGTNDIAAELHISYSTTRNHIRNIFAKLGVHSRAEVVAHAYRHGLLQQHNP